jgi:hypothetical protein
MKKDQSGVPGEASLACRSFLAKAALPFRRDKFQRETVYSSRRLNQQYVQTDQTDLSRLPCNESVRGEMSFSYLTGTK